MFDLLIRNATVIDGTGSAACAADVAIAGERIAAVTPPQSSDSLHTGMARSCIDAAGCIVVPGFIDVHGHSDLNILACPAAESKLRQGVTTEIFGNCGESAFPLFGAFRSSIVSELKRLGVEPTWQSASQYFAHLDALQPAINVATYLGHGSVRAAVMGYEDEAPSASALHQMKREIDAALAEGAIGMSTGLIYPPGIFAATAELCELQGQARRRGGIYASHVRSEGDLLLQAADEFLEIVRSTDSQGQFSHLKASGPRNWGKVVHVIGAVEQAVAEDARIWWDKYPYVASSTSLAALLPAWVLAGGTEAVEARLKDPSLRAKIIDESEAANEGCDGWDSVFIADPACASFAATQGKFLGPAARDAGIEPGDLFVELLLASTLRASMCNFTMNWDETDLAITHARGLVCSDAACRAPYGVLSQDCPHPRTYGTFGAFFRRYVKELGRLTLEEAVQKVTSLACSVFGIAGRGEIRPGYYADLVVLDWPEYRDCAEYGAPHRYCEGVRAVIVNGVLTLKDGVLSGRRAGRVLRRQGDTIQ
jgi:N-acyl-D-amino-acid deacylase